MTTTVDRTPSRHFALGPHDLAQRVPCTICHALTGAPCVEPDGLEREDPHNSRWIRYQHLMRQRPFTAAVIRPGIEGAAVGDLLLCVATPQGGVLRVLAEGIGGQARPEFIDSRAVEFQAFVEDSSRRSARTGRRPHRRPQFGASA